MDLSVTTQPITLDNQSWLGSASGTNSAATGVLAISAFATAPTTYYPDGFIRSGTPLGKYTSGANLGKYGPHTPGATDGTQNLYGFLFTGTKVPTSGADCLGAILDGTGGPRVIVALLPITINATSQATNPHFIYA